MDTNNTTDISSQKCRVRKRTLRDWVDLTILPNDEYITDDVRAFFLNHHVSNYTYEDVLHIIILKKAIQEGDIRHYLAIMEVLYDKKIGSSKEINAPIIMVSSQEEADLVREDKNY